MSSVNRTHRAQEPYVPEAAYPRMNETQRRLFKTVPYRWRAGISAHCLICNEFVVAGRVQKGTWISQPPTTENLLHPAGGNFVTLCDPCLCSAKLMKM